MDEARTPRGQTQLSRARRIPERLCEGRACDEVARGKAPTERRVRQIFADPLTRREAVEGGTHAVLQIDPRRFASPVASEGLADATSGDRTFVKVLDRLDRRHGLGGVRGNRNAAQAFGDGRNRSRNGRGGTTQPSTLRGRGRRSAGPRDDAQAGSGNGTATRRNRLKTLETGAETAKGAAARYSIASSSPIMRSITLSPMLQKAGSLASRPNGCKRLLYDFEPPAASIARYRSAKPSRAFS